MAPKAVSEFEELWDRSVPETEVNREDLRKDYDHLLDEFGGRYDDETILRAVVMSKSVDDENPETLSSMVSGYDREDILGVEMKVPRSDLAAGEIESYEETLDELASAYMDVRQHMRHEKLPSKASDQIPMGVRALGLSEETMSIGLELISRYEASGKDSGKRPSGLAASAVYAAATLTKELERAGMAGEESPQTNISSIFGVKNSTVRKRYREILDHSDLLF